MTSKEWIKSLNFRLTFIKGKIEDLEDEYQYYTMVDKDKVNEIILKEEIEIYKKIEKDLEILEIIKMWSFIQENYKDGYGTFTQFLCNIHTIGMEEDFKKVKEWLENDK